MGIFFAFLTALGFSIMNVMIRKGVRPGDENNGILVATIVNVVILSSIVIVRSLVDEVPVWSTRGALWFAASGFVASFLGRNTMFAGIRHAGPSRAGAIKNAAPLVTVAVGVLVLSEPLSPLATVGIVLGCAGILLVIYEAYTKAPSTEAPVEGGNLPGATKCESPKASVGSRAIFGILLSALAAIFYGLGQAIRVPGFQYVPDPFFGAAIAIWTGLVSYLVMISVQGNLQKVILADLRRFNIYFLLAGIASTVGQLSFFIAITFTPVSRVSVIAASETLLTVFLAALIIRGSETITFRILAAAIIVFAGGVFIAMAD